MSRLGIYFYREAFSVFWCGLFAGESAISKFCTMQDLTPRSFLTKVIEGMVSSNV